MDRRNHSTQNNSQTGNIFNVNADRVTLRDIVVRGWQNGSTFIDGWSNGRAIAVLGDDVRIYNPTIRDPERDPITGVYAVGSGGIRVNGGKRFLCIGGSVDSGDDSLAFVPNVAGGAQNLTGDSSVEDATVDDMVLISRAARAANLGLSTGDDSMLDPGMWQHGDPKAGQPTIYQTSNLRRIKISNIAAFANGASGLYVRNDYSSGAIEDIDLVNVSLRCGPNMEQGVTVRARSGPIRRVRMVNVSVLVDPVATAAKQDVVQIAYVDGLSWTGGRVDPPVNVGTVPGTVKLQGLNGATLRDLSIGCGDGNAVAIRGDAPPASPPNEFGQTFRISRDVTIEDSVVENVKASKAGVTITDAVNTGLRGVRVTGGLTATLSGALPGGTLTGLTAVDPAVADTYTVTVQAGGTFFIVTRAGSGPTPVNVGQGQVGTRFVSAGLSFLYTNRSSTEGNTFTITVAASIGTGVSIGANANAWFLDQCDLIGLPVTSLGQAPATIETNGSAVVTANTMLLSPPSGATIDLTVLTGGFPGSVVILRKASASQPAITVKTGGNLKMQATPFVMDKLEDAIVFQRGASAATPVWYQMSASDL